VGAFTNQKKRNKSRNREALSLKKYTLRVESNAKMLTSSKTCEGNCYNNTNTVIFIKNMFVTRAGPLRRDGKGLLVLSEGAEVHLFLLPGNLLLAFPHFWPFVCKVCDEC
jgi:hypothetical protein